MGEVYIPVLKDNKDPHYRYKMPKLTAKVEGSGNGIKTVITNMTQIAKSLDRPPSYPTKYFGCELGANVKMNNDFVVNGSHDAEKLLQLLYGFIHKFVLCNKCKNPETSLSVNGKEIRQKCIACGHQSTIPKTLHKLTTYIISHPPEGSAQAPTNGKGKSKKSKKNDKKEQTNGHTNGSTNADNYTQIGNQPEEIVLNSKKSTADDEFDEEEFTLEAYSERFRELTDGMQNGMMDPKESAKLFSKLVQNKKDQIEEASIQKELLKEADSLGIKDKAVLILAEHLFTENIIEEIKAYRDLFLRFCIKSKKAQKYLMGAFEKIVGDEFHDKLFDNSMFILKKFYDEDIIEEDTIIEWAAKESKKYVSKDMSHKIHEKVAPFITWLKTAEVEEDSDEDDEDGNSEESTDKASQNGNSTENAKVNGDDEEDEDDDLFEFSHRVSGIQIESVNPTPAVKPVNADLVEDTTNQNDEDINIDDI